MIKITEIRVKKINSRAIKLKILIIDQVQLLGHILQDKKVNFLFLRSIKKNLN
jgi:hypothetical protein